LGLGLRRSLRLARPQGSAPASASEDGLRLARTQGSAPASASEDDLRLARPQGSASTSTSTSEGGLRLARPQGPASTSTSREIASSPDPGLGLRRILRLARPWAQTDHAAGVHHYPTPSQLRLRGNKTGIQSRLAPVTSNDGSPRASMTTVALSPLRKQGDVSKVPTAPTAVLLQGTNAPLTTTTPCTQGPSTSPTATLACT
jgi:hypothetical protein